MAHTPRTAMMLRELRRKQGRRLFENAADIGIHRDRECSHWMQHTVYGSGDRAKNGTWCQVCGAKLR